MGRRAVFILVAVLSISATLAIDRSFLEDLFNQCNGAAWPGVSNWIGAPDHCTFSGVSCGGTGGTRVTALTLTSKLVTGVIPTSVSLLDELQTLSLQGNALTGLPVEFSGLTALRLLNLRLNSFTAFPSFSMLLQLTDLDISGNTALGSQNLPIGPLLTNVLSLQGYDTPFQTTLPVDIASLTLMTLLDLHNCKLSGSVPTELSLMTNLGVLSMYGNSMTGSLSFLPTGTRISMINVGQNRFSGTFPPVWGPNIINFYIHVCSITGSMPQGFTDMTKVVNFDVQQNQLTGTLVIGPSWHSVLQSFAVSNNQLNGQLGTALSLLTSLRSLYLSSNSFTGSLPAELTALTNLMNLIIYSIPGITTGGLPFGSGQTAVTRIESYGTPFGGAFPTNLVVATAMNHLNMASCMFTGSVPLLVSTLTALSYLDISTGSLSGNMDFLPTALVYLKLAANSFTGSLPTQLLLMTRCTSFDMSNNKMTGSMPAALSGMTSLSILNLRQNSFTGPLPDMISICTRIQQIDFGLNSFTGPFPAAWTLMVNLKQIIADGNGAALTGFLPMEYSAWTDMLTINVQGNQLTGQMPDLPLSLQRLSFASNLISGSLPTQYSLLTALTTIDGSSNQMTGPLPPMPTRMGTVRLSSNRFTGFLPTQYATITFLTNLQIGSNSLTGSIPTEYSLLKVSTLILALNTLTGSLFDMNTMTGLQYLALDGNAFTSALPLLPVSMRTIIISGGRFISIPDQWTTATNMQSMRVSSASLTGSIPSDITQLASLQSLTLNGNGLTGTIPGSFNVALAQLLLNDNDFSGTIPAAITALHQMTNLALGGYNTALFSGSIPDGLSALTRLQSLVLTSMGLTGSIPLTNNVISTAIRKIDLSNNKLSGTVPAAFSMFSLLSFLRLDVNSLTGSIPGFSCSTLLTMLNLGNNQFSNTIPDSVTTLSSVVSFLVNNNALTGSMPLGVSLFAKVAYLDLSYNSLTGTVPNLIGLTAMGTFLAQSNALSGTLPSIGGSNIRDFNLGSNQLTGGLPFTYSQFNALSSFAVNDNLLTGTIPLGWSNMASLRTLNVANNRLSGAGVDLSGGMIRYADLSRNSITSHPQFGLSLQFANISYNSISSTIPASYSLLTIMTCLDMIGNQMSGSVPLQLSVLSNLRVFAADNNQLSGTLVTQIGLLTGLQVLGLCNNQITGVLPAQILGLSAARCFAGNMFDGVGCPSSACDYCPLGSAFTSGGAVNPSNCPTCTMGQYGASLGALSCSNCGVLGTYQNTTGATAASACKPCPQGYYCSSAPLGQPTACAAGTANPNSASTSASACVTCSIGSYSSTASPTCSSCPGGMTTLSSGSTSVLECATPIVYGAEPDSAPSSGGRIITITGVIMGNGTDITLVTLAGVSVSRGPQSDTSIVVTTAPTSPATGLISVYSITHGMKSAAGTFTFNPPGSITALSPTSGASTGNRALTILGTNLCNGTDVTQVTIAGTQVLSIVSQTSTAVVVMTPAGTTGGVVVLRSIRFGVTTSAASYAYNLPGNITAVFPNRIVASASTPAAERTITITGTNLGTGSDITQVTVDGIVVLQILSQSAMEVVVVVAASSSVGAKTVVVQSVDFGDTAKANAIVLTGSIALSTRFVTVLEGGTAASVGVSLTGSSLSTVTLSVTASSCSENQQATPAVLSFTNLVFSIQQFVDVSTSRDYMILPNRFCTVVLTSSSADLLYNGLVTNFTVQAVETDVAKLTYGNGTLVSLGSTQQMLIMEGNDAYITMQLNSIPTATVNVLFVPTFPVRLLTNTTLLTFTASNWNITQRFYVIAPRAAVALGAQWAPVLAQTVSADASYNALAFSVDILVLDDHGVSTVQISNVLTNTTEWGGASPVYVFLTRAVTGPVTVTATISDTSVAVVSPASDTLQPADLLVRPVVLTLFGRRDYIQYGYDLPFSVQVSAIGPAVSVSSTLSLYNQNVDVAGWNISKSQLTVNETGSTDVLWINPSSLPLSAVTVSVQSLHTNVTTVSPAVLTWSPSEWQTAKAVTVTGIRNPSAVYGDRATNVTISVSSGDVMYRQLAPVAVPVLNKAIHWPNVVNLRPLTIALIGVNISMNGDFQPGVQVQIANNSCINITREGTTFLSCVTPPMNASDTYQNLTVMNTDGGVQLLRDAFFFTNDCPDEGYYGRGLLCERCPAGAYCPGGFRVWPTAGWWNENEFSGRVYPCNPAAACLGGRFSTCATGYESVYCGSCSSDYYRTTDFYCDKCQDQGTIGLLLLLQFAFILFFMILSAFVSDDTLSTLAFIISALRGLWIVAGDLTGLPAPVYSVLKALSLLSADLNFSQPGCSGVSTFAALFGVNMGVVFGTGLLLAVIIFVQHRVRMWRLQRNAVLYLKEQEDLSADAERAASQDNQMVNRKAAKLQRRNTMFVLSRLRQQSVVHASRVLFCYTMFIFAVVFIKAFQGLHCVNVDGVLRLYDDLTMTCFEGAHIIILIVSILMVLFVVVTPAVSVYVCYKVVHGTKVSAAWAGVAVSSMDDFVGRSQWFSNGLLAALDTILGAVSIFVVDIRGQFLGKLIITASAFLFVLIVRPFAEVWKTVSYLMVSAASLLAILAPLAMSAEGDAQPTSTAYIGIVYTMMALMLAYFLLLTLLLVRFAWEKIRKRHVHMVGAEQEQLPDFLAWQDAGNVADGLDKSGDDDQALLKTKSFMESASADQEEEDTELLQLQKQLVQGRDDSERYTKPMLNPVKPPHSPAKPFVLNTPTASDLADDASAMDEQSALKPIPKTSVQVEAVAGTVAVEPRELFTVEPHAESVDADMAALQTGSDERTR
eukprot:TRINITY_DN1097_c0_g1_i1.p1 TRINITY_DN1097_c0_g1~~TRINITY_DN1097_c0_g1_i1.p1  ORF type:complete len:2798 (+),score=590.51 TRINITY_DN1097_c0_g1_i1:689-9082(+)